MSVIGWKQITPPQYYSYLKEAGIDISLKIFLAAETAASHGQIDNPTLGNEFVFDWIAARLATNAATK